MSGSSWVNWKKKLNLGDPLQSTTSHLRQSSKSSFLLDLPPSASISSACNFLFCTPSAGQEDESAPHHGHPRHPAPILKQRLERGGTVLHERETESWQGLFDIYEEFIQRSEKPVPGFSGQSSSTSAMIHFIHAQFSRPRRLVL